MADTQPITARAAQPLNETPVEYRDVAGFPGYRVGDDGTVWSKWRRGPNRKMVIGDLWNKLKPALKSGYPFVVLSGGGRKKQFHVHRLVLEAFGGPCPDGHECAHDNGIRTDCRLANLLWKTTQANHRDKIRHGTIARGTSHGMCKLDESTVRDIRAAHADGKTTKQLMADYGLSQTHVLAICSFKVWKHI
jgi:hypothetical protein